MDDISIRVRGVSKEYRLGEFGAKTLQQELQSRRARRRGREDPNLRLGVDPTRIGQRFLALDDISLTVRRGERLGIIGPNGAGKSTLLKLLCRITAPTKGEIDLYGRVSSMLEVGTGFHREMTGRENIYMNGAILGMTRREIDERMEDIIAFSEIGPFIDTPVKRYSSGMYVKLAFSVAAHLHSEILIMDEVLAVGDLAFRQKCLDKLRATAEEENRTILYVSHSMDTIRRLCDRCIVLGEGHLLYDGDPDRAIAVYMDRTLGENGTDADLRNLPRNGRLLGDRARLTHVTLPDRDLPVFAPGEPLRLRLRVQTGEPLKNLCFRLTLRTETDTGIGTAWSEPFSLPAAGEYDLDFSFPTENIMKGIFYLSLGLYRPNEGGRRVALDHLRNALRVECSGGPVWNTQAFGPLQLRIDSGPITPLFETT